MINSICDSLLQLLLIFPLIIIAKRSNQNVKPIILLLASFVFLASSVTNDYLSDIAIFKGQRWNWTGKIGTVIIAFVFIFFYKSIKPKQFGLSTKMETNNAQRIFLFCAGYILLRLVLYITMTNGPETFRTEAILYQATMPGLAEEIIFRGILLTLFNQVFLNPKWTFANVSFGWGTIITSLLFGIIHGVYFDNSYHFQFNLPALLRTAFDGFLFALLAEKTKSLLPGILFHNILNLIGNH